MVPRLRQQEAGGAPGAAKIASITEEVDEGEVDMEGLEEKDVDLSRDAGEREQRESSGGVESERWGYRERNHGIDNVRRKT